MGKTCRYKGEWQAIGFIFPNSKCLGSLYDFSFPVDEVEKRTGMDFFSSLPDDIEKAVEENVVIKDWNY